MRGVPLVVGAAAGRSSKDDQGHVGQAGGLLGLRGVPLVVGSAAGRSSKDDQGHVGQAGGLLGVRGVPLAVEVDPCTDPLRTRPERADGMIAS